jgi:protease I
MERGKQTLRGKKVAILAADGFEYVELSVPRTALRLAGAELELVSLHAGKIRGVNLTEPTKTVRVDKTLEQAAASDYDALLLPGGFIGPDFLRQSRLARDFVQAFDAAEKPIATLCHGPWLLVSAELTTGRHLASWPSLRDDIVHAGGIWHDLPLVWDRNWVSSRGPQDLGHFVPAMIELFATGQVSAERLNGSRVLQSESSPKPDQPVRAALAAARVLPGPTIRAIGVAALGTAAGVMLARRIAS